MIESVSYRNPSEPRPDGEFHVRRLFGLATLLCIGSTAIPARAASDVVSALLRAQTQAFSDAGISGNAAVMDRLLDPNVIFVNEEGDAATKRDLVGGASPPTKGVRARLTVTDWSCHVFGDVAIASFVDDQREDFHGQLIHARFRSVETWRRSGSVWRMIGSETLALQHDPLAVGLPARTLEEYVGTYRAAPDVAIAFTRKGDELFASLDGGAVTPQRAELRDVFFTPGHTRARKIFRRDASGKIVDVVVRREGHDIVFRRRT